MKSVINGTVWLALVVLVASGCEEAAEAPATGGLLTGGSPPPVAAPSAATSSVLSPLAGRSIDELLDQYLAVFREILQALRDGAGDHATDSAARLAAQIPHLKPLGDEIALRIAVMPSAEVDRVMDHWAERQNAESADKPEGDLVELVRSAARGPAGAALLPELVKLRDTLLSLRGPVAPTTVRRHLAERLGSPGSPMRLD